MKNLAIGLFLVFSIATARAQTPDSVWHLVNSGVPLLTNMAWPSNDTGFLLGGTSDFRQTTDGGESFTTHSNLPSILTSVSEMSWPSAKTGYIAGTVYPAKPVVLKSVDAGNTWIEQYPVDTTISLSHIDFPAVKVGYASGLLADGSKNYILNSTDSGKTWQSVYESDNLSFGKLSFINAKNGIVFAQGASDHIAYTTNGGITFGIVPIGSDSALNFLHWNADGSWLAGSDSVYRSTDSGKSWVSVIPYSTVGGPAYVGAFHDSLGFVFRENAPVVLFTRDYGVTWKSDTLPRVGQDSVQALQASMPSDSVAYLLAVDPSTTTNVLMKIKIPRPTPSGGGGVVAMAPSNNTQFSAVAAGNSILFTANSADRSRTIDVMDILGRACTSVTLPPGATTSQLRLGALQPGSYFARLGSAIVKFAVWN